VAVFWQRETTLARDVAAAFARSIRKACPRNCNACSEDFMVGSWQVSVTAKCKEETRPHIHMHAWRHRDGLTTVRSIAVVSRPVGRAVALKGIN
jgi:hypothetical protein